MKKLLMSLVMLLVTNTAICLEYVENWENGNNEWLYWDKDGVLMPGGWYSYDLPMEHSATGGVSDSGYVFCDLSKAGIWQPGSEDMYWPAYLLDDQSQLAGPIGSISDHFFSIYLNDLGSANLMDGSIHFFVGEYIDNAGSGTWTWFLLKESVSIGANDWQKSMFKISSNEEDWIKYDGGAGLTLDYLLTGPQQLGFAIKDTKGEVQGELGFDSLTISAVPEPSVVLLSIWGFVWLTRKIRR